MNINILGDIESDFMSKLTWVWISIAIIGTGVIASLSSMKHAGRTLVGANIQIINPVDSGHFLYEKDIEKSITTFFNKEIEAQLIEDVHVYEIENLLKENPFVSKCDVSCSIKGHLDVKIQEQKPIMRIISENKGVYLTAEGNLIPLSSRYSPRVLILEGLGTKEILNDSTYFQKEKGKNLLNFVDYVLKDPFWAAQIAVLEMNALGSLSIIPQAGKEIILFGSADLYVEKLQKLERYYEDIIPKKGWNTYKTVDVRFKGQIVCK